jgi:LysR family cys regulon transcriptional activator
MNFQQLRIIRETVRQQFNLTEVADALATSQSGVSKHIRDLEEELGFEIFQRHGKRLLGLTEPGSEIIGLVDKILTDAGNIRRIADQLAKVDEGELIVATTHTQARYVLPRVVAEFKKSFPGVRLVLHQASPAEIGAMLLDERADIGIATEAVAEMQGVSALPYYSWHHAVIVPKGHALEKSPRVEMADLEGVPIVTYHVGYTGRPAIDMAFARAGLKPDIVMEAIDADVIKAYVALGLGIGIIAGHAFDPARDDNLSLLSGDHLFQKCTSHVAVKRGRFLRGYAYRFIELCRTDLPERDIRKALSNTV